jgi:hypothetical protein
MHPTLELLKICGSTFVGKKNGQENGLWIMTFTFPHSSFDREEYLENHHSLLI